MKLLDILKTANSNLLRNKGRSFLTILAIFIGSFTIILTTGINTGVNNYIDKQMASAGGEGYLEIMPLEVLDLMNSSMMGGGSVQEYNPDKGRTSLRSITSEDIAKIAEIPGLESVRAWTQVSPEYITSDRTDKKWQLRIFAMPSSSINVDMASGEMVDVNSDQPQIALDEKFVEPLGLTDNESAVGQTVWIAVMNQVTKEISEVSAIVTGIMNPSVISMGSNWTNETLQNKLHNISTAGLPDEYRERSFLATAQISEDYLSEESIQEIKDKLREMGYTANTIEDSVGMMKTFFDAITIVLLVFGGIALVAASIGIINTLYMAVQERTREIGLMKAMGLSKGKIRLIFSLEAVALGFWGSLIGVVVAYVVSVFANQIAVETFLSGLPGFVLVQFEIIPVIVIIVIVMLIAFLAGTMPARRASKLDPIEALRYE